MLDNTSGEESECMRIARSEGVGVEYVEYSVIDVMRGWAFHAIQLLKADPFDVVSLCCRGCRRGSVVLLPQGRVVRAFVCRWKKTGPITSLESCRVSPQGRAL